MQTKLTLRMDAQLIHDAKRIAQSRGKSLSQLVADYFRLLKRESEGKQGRSEVQATSWTQSLIGFAKPTNAQAVDTDPLRLDYLAEKYQLGLKSSHEDIL